METKHTGNTFKTHLVWAFLLVASSGFAFYGGYELRHYLHFGRTEYTVRCTRVIDGDTIEIVGLLDGEPMRVRILGIDAFEIRMNRKLREQAQEFGLTPERAHELGLYAKKTAERNLLNKDIVLRFEGNRIEYDNFGRLLAYVYVDGVDFGKFLLKNGLAYTRTEDHVRNRYYEMSTLQAQRARAGIFSGG